MKIASDVGDPKALVTNAEVLSFLKSRRDQPGGEPTLVARLVTQYVSDSPAGKQTVGSVVRLRDALAPYKLLDEEFVRICNLRAECDTLLERVLTPATLQRLSDDDWETMKTIINDTLEARPGEDEANGVGGS